MFSSFDRIPACEGKSDSIASRGNPVNLSIKLGGDTRPVGPMLEADSGDRVLGMGRS